MATRSLTDVFVLMRNNASQNRHIYSEQVGFYFPTSNSLHLVGLGAHN